MIDFVCDSMPSFVDAVIASLAQLSKLPKAIPLLLRKFFDAVADELRAQSASAPNSVDDAMLRGLHSAGCAWRCFMCSIARCGCTT